MGKNNVSPDEIQDLVWKVAQAFAAQGPGYAQEGVVMRKIADDLNIRSTANPVVQQQVLDAWHDLFTSKKLGWGFNLDNPNSPFFHIRNPG